MAEMIIPGTYIEVRAEGLISAGRVATGIVGVVGTAARGRVGEPVTLASFANARELFGLPDTYNRPDDGAHPLTLVRALEHIYNNGAATVVAVRIAGSSQAQATYAVQNAAGQTVATLTAKTPGSWGNSIKVDITPAEDDCRVDEEIHTTTFDRLNYGGVVPSAENRLRIFRGTTRRIETLNLVYRLTITDEEVVRSTGTPTYRLAHVPVVPVEAVTAIRVMRANGSQVNYGPGTILYNAVNPPAASEVNINTSDGALTFGQVPTAQDTVIATYAADHSAPTSGQVLVTTWDGTLTFATNEAPGQANGDRLVASYLVERAQCVLVTLTYETTREPYITPDGRLLVQLLNSTSALVEAAADGTHGADKPGAGLSAYFGTGSNTPGNNGADAGRDEYAAGLDSLANQLINIVVLAGQHVGTMGSVLEAHLNATAQTDYERIGVIGAPGRTLAEFLGHTAASDRLIVVAPGLLYPDGTRVPAAYTAAAVAGLISSLPVQTSLTNKTLTIPGLDLHFNRGEQEQAIKRNLLSVVLKNGFRVLKGLTSQGEGEPFSAIPTRRIVDYAKYGVRSAANPYL
ncbi:MAG TPA: phage tail sheath subtilisin-like domain-containing protein, partial [Candidatus Tectomicrobia bacterium]